MVGLIPTYRLESRVIVRTKRMASKTDINIRKAVIYIGKPEINGLKNLEDITCDMTRIKEI